MGGDNPLVDKTTTLVKESTLRLRELLTTRLLEVWERDNGPLPQNAREGLVERLEDAASFQLKIANAKTQSEEDEWRRAHAVALASIRTILLGQAVVEAERAHAFVDYAVEMAGTVFGQALKEFGDLAVEISVEMLKYLGK